MGHGVIGNTTDFGSVVIGSSPIVLTRLITFNEKFVIMKSFKVSAKVFLSHLAQCGAVVSSKNSVPAFADVVIDVRAGSNVALVTTSDGDIWLSVKMPLVSAEESFSVCVDAVDLLGALRVLDDTDVEMRFDDTMSMVCDYGNGQFRLPYRSAESFPMPQFLISDATEYILGGGKVFRGVEKSLFAVASDSLRPIINGVHFDFTSDAMVTAATDGFRLARYRDTEFRSDDDDVKGFTLGTKACTIAKSVLGSVEGDVKLSFTDKVVIISNTDFKLTARLIEGVFPNYDKVIPQEHAAVADVDIISFKQALKRVLPMGDINANTVILRFSGDGIDISAEDLVSSKSAKERISCDYHGEDMIIGFSGARLLQAVSNFDGNSVTIELLSPKRAAVMYDVNKDNYLTLVMPTIIS